MFLERELPTRPENCRCSVAAGTRGRITGAPNPLLPLPAAGDNWAMEAEPPKVEPTKRKRQWFQFSLRTLMIFTFVSAIRADEPAAKVKSKPAYAATYATHFPLTENPISDSGHWTNGKTAALDWGDVSTTPGLAIGQAGPRVMPMRRPRFPRTVGN